ncbi:Protein kinase domain-containing protein [Tolypocladium paradoxum]|uniref:non-specific serine/threonine protein kinase n=1 Tax=Tolypocladium paradoxum TaxID=94208 RepID=A0A2S4KPQ7_9HYPO|nr:Protein kinase domain-containing protein [Tolypocladium paradoxum]
MEGVSSFPCLFNATASAMIGFRLLAHAYRAPARAAICSSRPHLAGLLHSMHSKRVGTTSRMRWCRSLVSQASPAPELLPPGTPIDEERIPGYNFKHYYPANHGDVLLNRYRLEAKIGWGSTSTVWLAYDISRCSWLTQKRYVAIKICNCDTPEEDMTYELDMSIHLSSANSKHRGRGILGTAIAGCKIESPRGDMHLVLIFEPLREPLWLFRKRIAQQESTTHEILPLFKTYLRILLEGLDYMHTQAHVIHTDLKLDNIMIAIEDRSTIDNFVHGQAAHPMARKHIGDHTVYRCHNDFGPVLKSAGNLIPHITDFGLAQRGDKAEPLIHPIQPDEYRAPEVLLGIGWSYSADVWNFGAMIWDLLAGQSLFGQQRTLQYSPAQHLADMISLIGDIPPSLIKRERDMRHWRWSPAAMNPNGRLSSSAAEYFGGPFFADDGTFVHTDLIPHGRSLERELPECILKEKRADLFVKFIRRMLCWVPEERATASELLSDPWLDSKA